MKCKLEIELETNIKIPAAILRILNELSEFLNTLQSKQLIIDFGLKLGNEKIINLDEEKQTGEN
jgi:hypothetical protein